MVLFRRQPGAEAGEQAALRSLTDSIDALLSAEAAFRVALAAHRERVGQDLPGSSLEPTVPAHREVDRVLP